MEQHVCNVIGKLNHEDFYKDSFAASTGDWIQQIQVLRAKGCTLKTITRVGASIAIALCLFAAGCGGVGIASAGTPSISQIVPQSLAAGSSDATVEIVGTHLNDATVVLWNGTALSTTLVDDTTVSSPVDSASIAAPGTAELQLMNSVTGSKSNTFTLPITARTNPLSITSTSLPNGTVGTSYSASLAATGGTTPYTWQWTSGTMPAGLSLQGNSIVGTPSAAGTYSLGLLVTDKSRPSQSKFIALTIIIATRPITVTPLSITTGSLPAASYGVAYSQSLQATGGSGSYSWSVASGSLPAGLSVSSSGVISGTPSLSGTFGFTVSVSDTSKSVQTRTAALSISVAATPLRIGTTSLTRGTLSTAYSQTLSVSGGTPGYIWSLASGSLPAGLSLSTAGVISGTPDATGTVSFVAGVKDSGNPALSATVSLSITIASTSLSIISTSVAQGIYGRPYSGALQATGGTPGYNWSVASGNLPAGLSLSAAGVISGTPTSGGTASFTAAVHDSGSPMQTATAQVTIKVSPAPLTITAATLPSVNVGGAYSQSLQATGGTAPYQWSISSGHLPAGLTLTRATGAITGTPSTAGTAIFTVTASDSSNPVQTASVLMSVLVNPAQSTLANVTPLSILVPASASGTVGSAFTKSLGVSGGTSPYTWSIQSGSLPAGLSLSASGIIAGTPASGSNGSYSVTVSVADAESPAQIGSSTMAITIAAAPVTVTPLSIVSSTLASGTTGTSYSQTLQASGGTTSYSWSVASGSLPAGLTLSSGGTISGTPTTSGNSTFTAQVIDSSSPAQTQSASLSIAVAAAAPISISGTVWYVRPDGGTRYSANMTSGQCNGKSDAPYSGTGVNQNCAFKDFRYLWDDQSYGGYASWVIAGGDTVVIRGCASNPNQRENYSPSCRIGWDAGSGTGGGYTWCYGGAYGSEGSPYGCYNPPVPAGTSANHTKIYGACALTGSCNSGNTTTRANLAMLIGGFGLTETLNLRDTSYVDVDGIEITSHPQAVPGTNGECTRAGSPAYPAGCSNYPGANMSDYDSDGVEVNANTVNVSLTDVWIDGHGANGIHGPIGAGFTMNRVAVNFNTLAGFNFDDGSDSPNGANASINANYVTMEGNGCLQQWPIVNAGFPARACWDDASGGFGDSWSGQDATIASFVCNHCAQIYNTKDGFIGPHTQVTSLLIENSESIGNMGQQWKWNTTTNATIQFLNNLTLGNCMAQSGTIPGAGQTFALSSGLPGAYLSDFCRAAGDTFSFSTQGGSNVAIKFNTVVSYATTVFDFHCGPTGQSTGTCGNVPYAIEDNIFLGYTNPNSNSQSPSLFYYADSSTQPGQSHSYNVEYGIRNGDPCGGNIICSDPLLVNEPAQGAWPPESIFYPFASSLTNWHPTSGSPAVHAGISISGLLTDLAGVTRSNPPSIGPFEP